MKARISRIIQGQFSNPKPGTFWTCLVMTLALCATVGMALAQPRPEEELRAMAEAPHMPMQRGAIVRQESMEIAKIGRLNVLTRLLEQLVAQTAETERALEQAENDSDRHMRKVELDTLREQMAHIKAQIQQTKRPESMTEPRQSLQRDPAAPRPIQTRDRTKVEPHPLERRVLEERHRQLTEELKTVEPELRTRFNAGLIPADEMNARLRVLKNELGMIDAQLKDQPNAPEPQLRIYRLEHSQAGQMASTLARVIRQANITPDDNTNSLIVNTTPDVHGQIEQLLRQLDVARTVKSTTSTSSASRTSGPVSTGTAQSRQPRPDRGVSGSSVNTRGATSQNLNAEVDELRGQVLRLNNQMQEMRALLQQLIQQEKPDRPDVRN